MNITSLNRDCLNEIFKHLPIEDQYRVRRVCKLFQTISQDVLGITSKQPKYRKINDEIQKLLKEVKKKKQQLSEINDELIESKHDSDQWNRYQIIKIIRRFNAMYSEIEGEVDPESVLKDVRHIKFIITYSHEGNCINTNIYDSIRCSCPISKYSLEYVCGEDIDVFRSNYSRFREPQWEGYFQDLTLRDFGEDRLVRSGFIAEHLLEHVMFRTIQGEIAYRGQHHKNVFAIESDSENDESELEDEMVHYLEDDESRASADDESRASADDTIENLTV